MTTLAKDAAQDEQRAWLDYADRLRGLEGAEYEREEQAAWEELQATLDDLGSDAARTHGALG